MQLRRGITGFRHFKDPPLPECDLSAFRAHCHAAARAAGGRVVRDTGCDDGLVTNFVWEVVEVSGVRVAVLLNRHVPVVGFAVPPGEGGPMRFLDGGGLADALRAAGAYEVASRADLERQVGSGDFGELAPAEMRQVEYWKPSRIGDVVFNFWD